MIHIVLYNIANNKSYILKLFMLMFGLCFLVSLSLNLLFSYKNTIEIEEKKLLYDNYYNSNLNYDYLFTNYECEIIDIEYTRGNYKLLLSENEKILSKKNYITISRFNNKVPKNVTKSYEANNVDFCYAGRLPAWEHELSIPYSLYINLYDSETDLPLAYDEIIGKKVIITKKDNLFLNDYIIVGITNDIFYDYYDNVLISDSNLLFEDGIIKDKRYYISNFFSIDDINKTIEEYGLNDSINYCGTQLGFYNNIDKMFTFSTTIYSSIIIPLIIMLITLWINSYILFVRKHDSLLNIMEIYGCSNFQKLFFLFCEIIFISFFAIIVSIAFTIPTYYLFVYLCNAINIKIYYSIQMYLLVSFIVVSTIIMFDIFTLLFTTFVKKVIV